MRKILLGFAFIGAVMGFTACGNDGMNEKELAEFLDNRDATAAAQESTDLSSDPKVTEIVTKWTEREVTTSQAKRQLKALGFTDAQVESALQDDGKDAPTATTLTSGTATAAATPAATQTPPASTPTTAPTAVNDLKGTGTKPTFTTNFDQGNWKVYGTDRLAENQIVNDWIKRLQNPAPSLWKTYPNIPNPDVPGFRVVNGNQVPDGVEYGTYDSPYCSSHPCDVPVGAWEYRLITGDYHVLGYECKGDMKKGCLLLLINVMDQSVTFRDQDVDNGFTVRGRFWNGDALEWGVLGLVSHASANMLNMPTLAREGEILNAGDGGNSGANCGIPEGCGTVDARVIVVAGDAPIAVLETTVTK